MNFLCVIGLSLVNIDGVGVLCTDDMLRLVAMIDHHNLTVIFVGVAAKALRLFDIDAGGIHLD